MSFCCFLFRALVLEDVAKQGTDSVNIFGENVSKYSLADFPLKDWSFGIAADGI